MLEDFFITEDNDEEADRDADIGDIENGPGVESFSEESEVGDIEVEEVNDLTVEEGSIIKNDAIENSINKISERAAEDKGERNSKKGTFLPINKNEIDNNNGSGDSKERESEFTADFNTERHTRILDKSKLKEITD